MKNLFVMLTLIVASAVASTAEAAMRVVVNINATEYVFYSGSSTGGGSFAIGVGPFTAVGEVHTSNFPGAGVSPNGIALISQVWTLVASGPTAIASFSAAVDVIADVAGVSDGLVTGPNAALVAGSSLLQFTTPGAGLVQVETQQTGNGLTSVSGTMTAYATIDGTDYSQAFSANAGDNSIPAIDVALIGSPFTLTNTFELANLNITGPATVLLTSQSSVVSPVPTVLTPEPTSMALAGFAGIGMAFGAIRRRRQVNQAA